MVNESAPVNHSIKVSMGNLLIYELSFKEKWL